MSARPNAVPYDVEAVTPTFVKYVRLGSGGMADVHLARMELDGQVEMVALKRLRLTRPDRQLHRPAAGR